MPKRGHTLAACRDDLDAPLDTVSDMKDERNSVFYRCKIDRKYNSGRSSIVLYPDFESGVVKIQSGQSKDLTKAEKTAVKNLKRAIPSDLSLPNERSGLNTSSASNINDMSARLARRRKIEPSTKQYINCDFMFGSVALIESLWSMTKFIVNDIRSCLSPQNV